MDNSISTAITSVADSAIPNLLPVIGAILAPFVVIALGIVAYKLAYRKAKGLIK